MSNTDYKSTDALMRYLRNNGISISDSLQKQRLMQAIFMSIKDIFFCFV